MNKLGIIVPYRDREVHLKKFIPHMNQFLKNKIDYKILIVEQDNNLLFNRGYIKNIGFDFYKKNCNYVCFHDVDLLPVSNESDYSIVNTVTKLAIYVSQFNFAKRPVEELGGVVLFPNSNFEDINGFSNNYWGWGLEDNDLGLRCRKKNIIINSKDGRYMSLPHKTDGDTTGLKPAEQTIINRKIFSEVINDENKLFSSGLSTLNYIINKIEEKENFIHIKVDFK